MKGIALMNLSIGYKDIPKVACTSIKEAVFKLQTNDEFNIKKQGTHVHKYYNKRKKEIDNLDYKFIVIRDPIKRFLSGYSNRVTHHKELSYDYLIKHKHESAKELLEKNPILNPGLGQFIEFLDDYYKTPSILHHLKPVSEIIETDLDFFDRVYKIENISEFESDISKIAKQEFTLPKSQTGGKKYSVKELNSQQMEFLIDFYKTDYELMKDFYTVDDIWKTWKK